MFNGKRVISVLVVFAALLVCVPAQAQTTATTTELRNFEVLAIDGSKVVIKDQLGTREVTLPAGFRMTIDGREMGVADLRPGMKGQAVVTTKVTSHPVTATEVRNAEVMAVSGNTIIVKNAEGYRKFTQSDINQRNVTVMREGVKVDLSQLRPGDRLTAMIITQKPPTVVTERDVQASLSSPPPPAAAAPAPAPAPPPPAPVAEPPAETLPKTGSDLPLLPWVASVSLLAGLALTLRRRARDAR